jgi:hypothetical protein
VKHFQNVAFSFQNISGLLGPNPEYDSHRRLSRGIGQAYVHFTRDLDPNGAEGSQDVEENILPAWSLYDLNAPTNMVLNATGSWVEDDTWRKDGIAYINTADVLKELLS